jgi:soluble lytic murein transglycosylase
MNRLSVFLLFSLVLGLILPAPVQAASLDYQSYRRAFAAIDAGHADLAYGVTAHAHDPVLNKIIRACYLGSPGNGASFAETAAFIAENPGWPGLRDIVAMAEQKIPANADPATVINWFTAHPPVTLAGFYRYVDTLSANGENDEAVAAIRKRWVDGEFGMDELTAFYARFGNLLTQEDIWARLDRVLWNNDLTGARRLYGIITPDMKMLAEARLALASQAHNADALYEQIPYGWRNDPGLLYERLRWLRHNNRDNEAISILAHAPSDLKRQDAWWEERQILIHRLIVRHDYNLAFSLAADHGLTDNKTVMQAEFLAGWLALRFLNDPGEARDHFQVLYDNATTAITRARGAYWLGRTLEASGDTNGAAAYYTAAAEFDTTYYGQLAAVRIEDKPVIEAKPEREPPARVRDEFYSREYIRAVERLSEIGERDRAHVFFKAATEAATDHSDFVLLTELAERLKRPDLAIEGAKAANQKNSPVEATGFPMPEQHVPKPPEPAFTYALIRQESMFNPGAASGVGAVGLMQLMPHTAQAVARQIGMKFRANKLAEPDYNLKLGTAFVQSQIAHFDGSYVLALAGYNAGPGRVHEWLMQMGDPRDPAVDPIDWIEMIPLSETRNYVQRILESLQIYRARLSGGRAPLMILQDLKR